LALRFSPDSRRLAFGGYRSVLSVALVENPANVIRMPTVSQIWSLEFASDNRILAGLGVGTIQLFRFYPKQSELSAEWVTTFEGRGIHRSVISVSNEESFLLAREEENAVELVRAADLLGFRPPPLDSIVLGSAGGFLLTYDEQTGTTLVRNATGGEATLLGIRPSRDCSPAYCAATGLYAVFGTDGAVHLFDARNWTLRKRVDVSPPPADMCFSKDGSFLAAGSSAGIVWIIDVATGKSSELPRSAHQVQFSPVDDVLAVANYGETTLALLSATKFHQLATIDTMSPIWFFKFHPRGDKLAVVEEYGISLWDVASRQFAGMYRGHRKRVRELAFSPNGRTAASIDAEAVHIWDVSTAQAFCSHGVWPTEGPRWLAFVDDATLFAGEFGSTTYYCFGGLGAADARFRTPQVLTDVMRVAPE
jgi:WD40 repeat protein